VTPYLTPEAVMGTLRFIASAPAGSGVVFDYPVSPELLSPMGRKVYAALSGWSAAAGEPWLSNFDPAALAGELRELGFGQVEDLGQAEINARYFAGRADGLGVGTLYHLAAAWV
jgi:O-methyltransferase involved in polyketide biosynthesis